MGDSCAHGVTAVSGAATVGSAALLVCVVLLESSTGSNVRVPAH